MNELVDYTERRKYKRFDFEQSVEYVVKKFIPQNRRKLDPEKKQKAISANMSKGGMQIIDDVEIEKGKILELGFDLNDKVNCRMFGKVKWNSFDTSIEKFRMGVEFLYVKEEILEDIDSVFSN